MTRKKLFCLHLFVFNDRCNLILERRDLVNNNVPEDFGVYAKVPVN